MEFIEYSKCTTCKNAKAYLDSRKVNYIDREIKKETPTYDEINLWISKYNVPIKKLFNTSGLKYKELNLKEKLNNMTDEEKVRLLASDGMLIKRPIVITDNIILIGFKENEWDKYFK